MNFFNFKDNGIKNDGDDITVNENTERVALEAIIRADIQDYVQEQLSDSGTVEQLVSEGVLNEKTIVKLDKDAKYQQVLKLTVLSLAKENNDAEFKRFVTIKKMERRSEERMFKKYGSKASKVAKSASQKWDPRKGAYKNGVKPTK